MEKILHEYDMNYLIVIFCFGLLTYFTSTIFELYLLFCKNISLEKIAEDTRQVKTLIELYLDNDINLEGLNYEEEEEEEVEVDRGEIIYR